MVHVRITDKMCQELKNHLHTGDGLEAVAFGVCGRFNYQNSNWLTVHKVFLVPHEKCNRKHDSVGWKTADIEHLLEEVDNEGFAIVKFHSHFVNNSDFSSLDDKSDETFFDAVYGWSNTKLPHASIIMYPDSTLKGRSIQSDLSFKELSTITVVGESIKSYSPNIKTAVIPNSFERNEQTFGPKTTRILKDLKVAIVGCSGTGSPTIEQLVRLGVGTLVLFDSDIIEEKNLNRIIGTKREDARTKTLKVDAIKKHIEDIDVGTKVIVHPVLIQENRQALNELASCDIIIGCVDSAEGRYYMNLISTYYIVPFIDIGVKLVADGQGGVDSINGNVNYVYPGSETLLERGVFTADQLQSEALKRISPDEHKKREVYFSNVQVDSPAVISVNMIYSAFAVNELLSRIHPFRYKKNSNYSSTSVNLTNWDLNSYSTKDSKSKIDNEAIGIGNKEPHIDIRI
jgi:hypothetical protein